MTDPTKPPVHKPRPILICVWYPAKKTDANPMEYRRYLDVPAGDALIAPFVKRLSRHVVTVVSDSTVGKEPANRTPAETAAFERLMATKTFAVKDAPPAEGRFPVVLHHAGLGGMADDNSVLFEPLASHGYVVSAALPELLRRGRWRRLRPAHLVPGPRIPVPVCARAPSARRRPARRDGA